MNRRLHFDTVLLPLQRYLSESVTTMNVQQAIVEFLQHGQQEKNLSDRTLRAYESDLSQFHLHVNDAPTGEITSWHTRLQRSAARSGPDRVRFGFLDIIVS